MAVSTNENPALRTIILISIVLNVILLFFGLLLHPTVVTSEGLLSLAAPIIILLVYGFLALFSPISIGKVDARILRLGVLFGCIGGTILSVDLITSYFLDEGLTARDSLIAYGLFLLLFIIVGFWGAYRTRSFRAGVTAAIWCVLIGLLIWFCVEFASYYLFSNTSTGQQFIQAEMQADFARSGASDYAAFVMADFYGAGFFHLLLGLIFATVLGSIGAFVGKYLPAGTKKT